MQALMLWGRPKQHIQKCKEGEEYLEEKAEKQHEGQMRMTKQSNFESEER